MRNLTGRRACVAALLLGVASALLGGCALFREIGAGGDDPLWQVAHYKGVHPGDVLRLAQTATEKEYPAQKFDSFQGDFETGWVYGFYDDLRRYPLRQRIIVHAESEGGVVAVRLRAKQERNETAGRLASAFDPGWEPTADDPVRAATMLQRLTILVKDVGEVVPEKKEGEDDAKK